MPPKKRDIAPSSPLFPTFADARSLSSTSLESRRNRWIRLRREEEEEKAGKESEETARGESKRRAASDLRIGNPGERLWDNENTTRQTERMPAPPAPEPPPLQPPPACQRHTVCADFVVQCFVFSPSAATRGPSSKAPVPTTAASSARPSTDASKARSTSMSTSGLTPPRVRTLSSARKASAVVGLSSPSSAASTMSRESAKDRVVGMAYTSRAVSSPSATSTPSSPSYSGARASGIARSISPSASTSTLSARGLRCRRRARQDPWCLRGRGRPRVSHASRPLCCLRPRLRRGHGRRARRRGRLPHRRAVRNDVCGSDRAQPRAEVAKEKDKSPSTTGPTSPRSPNGSGSGSIGKAAGRCVSFCVFFLLRSFFGPRLGALLLRLDALIRVLVLFAVGFVRRDPVGRGGACVPVVAVDLRSGVAVDLGAPPPGWAVAHEVYPSHPAHEGGRWKAEVEETGYALRPSVAHI
ncbi:hypothetical protein C8R45DRAFT_1125246 [Mycena sanguinolenta]|nr:hypothetical protein C8R45DRAFT_1125246 [Mycena sanguinolenta]